jgi:hypothetical protein
LPAPSRKSAVWLAHEDVEEQLDHLGGGSRHQEPVASRGSLSRPIGAICL